MTAVLLDTHTWAWSIVDVPRLSRPARDTILAADATYVSPISFFEIALKVRLGKWPAMQAVVPRLPSLLQDQGGSLASLEPAIGIDAGRLDWLHRDPFDRLLAATARHYRLDFVSADRVFDDVVRRVW